MTQSDYRRAVTLKAVLALALLAPNPSQGADEDKGPAIVPVADGVFAALQPHEKRFDDANSAIILTASGIVVVDTQASPATTAALLAEIRKLSDQPPRYLINTHWHGDHTQGNQVYRDAFPELEIIGHHSLAEDVPGRAAAQRSEEITAFEEGIVRAEARLREGISRDGGPLGDEERAALPGAIERARQHLATLHSVQTVPPTLTYGDELTLQRGGRTIRLLHFAAHTRGDTVVFLPDEKVLITGDLLDELPFGGHGYPTSWVATLDQLESLDFETIIPGHGGVMKGKEPLRKVRALVQTVIDKVTPLAKAGKALDEVQTMIDLSAQRTTFAADDPVAQRNFDAFLPPLVERAYLEARGELE